MKTAVDEVMQHCKELGLRRSRLMSRFYRFHRRNPQLLDFLLQELVTLRKNDWQTTSFEMLWHHARWVLTYLHRVPGETFHVCQNLMPHYSRLVIILFPEFNRFYRLKKAKADADFGVRIEPGNHKSLRGLVWADGTPIESGWRPSAQYVIPTIPVPRRPPVRRGLYTLPKEVQRHAG
jgi:hypothetical protein